MKIGFKSDPGRIRDNNEDWYIVDERIKLFLVADGVGGHQAGEIASRLGAETIQHIIKSRLAEQHENNLEPIIKEAVDSAHDAVLHMASSNPDLNGMGTTVVLGLFQNDKLYVAHVGDSRAYLINSQTVTALTEDHSLVAGLVRNGDISKEEAKTHKMSHIITQCLGSDGYFGPEIKNFGLNNGDIFLLCSDGLTDMVEDADIEKVVLEKRNDPQNCADDLVKLANKRGGRDNITVVLVENE